MKKVDFLRNADLVKFAEYDKKVSDGNVKLKNVRATDSLIVLNITNHLLYSSPFGRASITLDRPFARL